MTSDFKDKILKWLTGNYEVSSGNNVPQFSDVESRANNLETQLANQFTNGYFLSNILQGNDTNNNGVGYTIICGYYYNSGFDSQGFICILDEDFDIVETITKYSSGTDFGTFEIMGVGDDGNFFAIEKTSSNVKRFVMMNNIIAKLPTDAHYKVVLRKSYNLSGQSNNIDMFTNVIKAPEQSRYLIVGNDTNVKVIATELVVNVGVANEWHDYTYTTNVFVVGDLWASWNAEGNLTFKIAGFRTNDYTSLTYGELSGSSSNVGSLSLTTYGSAFSNVLQYVIRKNNSTSAYFSILQSDYSTATIKLYRLNNGSLTLLKTITSVYDFDMEAHLYKIGEEIFYLYSYSYPSGSNWKIMVGKIIGDNLYEKEMLSTADFTKTDLFMVQKQFNLYNFFIQITDTVYSVDQIYNSLNYNGADYQALNSMIPNSATLSSNGVVIFARNLYNRIINENTTISTLNVPNNFINDITIDNESLYGETNSLLVDNDDNLQTNIYEELMINFVNTLTMSNENDENNKILNQVGATRLNNSISQTNDYSSCQLIKYKINYSDNTSKINVIKGNEITRLRGSVRYTFMIFVPTGKNIENIQLISNDENTVYQTIDTSNLEQEKFYLITQDVKVI